MHPPPPSPRTGVEKMSHSVRSLQAVDTVLNADAAEWCPYPGLQHILLCGTYKLQESPADANREEQSSAEDSSSAIGGEPETQVSGEPEAQVRNGGVTVYTLSFDEGLPHLDEYTKVDLCGILDIKWMPTVAEETQAGGEKALFGLVDAEGYFQLLHLDGSDVIPLTKVHLSDTSLGLSLGWASTSQSSPRVSVSDSAGCVTVFDVASSQVEVLASWSAHGYEAWITAFHNTDGNIVYTGGDDCLLKRWDLRDTTRPTLTSRRHSMGVCSIQSHPLKEHVLATGSYDEELIVWDDRAMRRPLTSASLGGGVWRVKWDPFTGERVLTATMYNGTHITDASDLGLDSLPVVAEYTDHNLAYGADWCRLSTQGTQRRGRHSTEGQNCGETGASDCLEADSDNTFLISTCSFYDHSLHLWTWENKTS